MTHHPQAHLALGCLSACTHAALPAILFLPKALYSSKLVVPSQPWDSTGLRHCEGPGRVTTGFLRFDSGSPGLAHGWTLRGSTDGHRRN